MALSERAQRMLARGGRTPHPTDPAEIAGYLERAGVPTFEPVVAFAMEYSGIWYRVRGRLGDERHPMRIELVSGYRGRGTGAIGVSLPEDGDEHYYFRCIEGLHQGVFFIDQHGALYLDYEPLSSTVSLFLEWEAMRDELMDSQPEWLEVSVRMSSGDAARLAQALDLPPVPEASDSDTTWWANGGLRAVHGSADRCIVYARTREEAGQIASLMCEIEATTVPPYTRTWPYRLDGSSAQLP